MAVPNTALTLPSTYPQAGGVAIVLEGANGNVYYQFVNPSTMFQGYQNTGTPTAWQGNPFQIGPAMTLNCGPVVSCSTYLGGGITRMTVRFTAYDGDNQAGMFDFNDLSLRINGSNFGASSGNWSVVATQTTNITGTTLVSSNTGFGNNTLDTGWFQSSDAAILSSVLSTGTITATVFDKDANDNFWDFKQGNDATTSVVPLNVAPGVTMDKATVATSFTTVGQVIPYSFTIRNIGSVWLNTISVSDPKVTGVVCPAPPAAVTANLDPAEQIICTASYTIKQSDIDAGVLNNTATATGTPQAGVLGPVTDTNSIPGPASAPGIDLVKSATPSPFGAVGSNITYAFSVKNTGNVTLSTVVISDPLLPSLSCTIAPIAPSVTVIASCTGNTMPVTQARVDAGTVANTASITSRAPNNAVVTDTSAISITGPAQVRSLLLDKSSPTANYNAVGGVLSYSYLLRNTGNVTLTGALAVTDNKATVSCPAMPPAGLAPNGTLTCTASYTINQADLNAGSVLNVANASIGATAAPSDQVTVPAVQLPALSVDKTSPTANFDSVGDVLSYSYLLRNTGNVTLLNTVTVSDNKASVSCPALPPLGLAPNGTLTCTASFTVTQADIDAGSVVNTASATTTFGAGNTVVTSATDQVTVPALQSPSLGIVKSATAVNFTNVGDIVSYQYLVTNTGNTTLVAPITVSDNRVSPVTCPASPPGGLPPGSTLTCTSNYSVLVEDLDIGSITNIATASSGPTTSAQVAVTVPTGASPALSIDKTSTSTTFNAVGDIVPYSFLVTNSGNATFTRRVNVTDTKIGTIACWIPPSTGPPANRIFTPGETLTCSANYTITQADLDLGFVTNQASSATTYGAANVPVASPPDSVTVNAIQNPALDVTKSVAALPVTAVGQVLTYTIRANNTGDVTLSGITVTDPLIPALSCTATSLAVGATRTCTGTYTVTQANFDAGQINNTATANASGPQGAPVSDTGSNTVTIAQSSSVSIAKAFTSNADQDASGTVSRNDTLTYSVTVSNDGNVTQNNVVVSDVLLTPSSRTCVVLAPGAICQLMGTLNVTQTQVNGGSVLNTADVTTALLPASESVSRTVAIPQVSSLAIDKQSPVNADNDSSASVTLNDVLTYTVIATNTGNVTQSNVSVSDPMLTPPSNICPSLAPGATCSLIGTKTVTQANIDAGSIANTAGVTSTLITTAVTDSVTTTVAQTSALTIAKAISNNADEDGSTTISRNDTLTYQVTVTNDGTRTQNNVMVADPLLTPGSTTCASVAPGATCSLTGNYVVTQANVDAGALGNTAQVTSTLLPSAETVLLTTAIPQSRGLSIDKSSPTANYDSVGDVLSYSYLLTNTGNVTLNGSVSVADDKTTVACPTLPGAGLAPAASVTCTASYVVTQANLDAGFVLNTASGMIGSTVSATDQVNVPAVQTPRLSVDKTSPTSSFRAVGDVLSYSYVVRNTGNITLTAAITVADDKASVTCPPLPPTGLAPNSTITCTASHSATQSDIDSGSVINTASATSGTVTSLADQVTVPAIRTPGMSMVKNATAVNFTNIGDTVSYEYIITNTGNTTLSDAISVSDNRVSLVSCPTMPVGGLAPGATYRCTSNYTVIVEDLDIGSLTNLAFATSGPTTSPQTSATIPTGSNPALTISKSTTTTSFNTVGDVVAYSFRVTNSGNATFTRRVDVTDNKIGTIACWAPVAGDLTLTPGETVTCAANYSTTQDDLDAGFVTNQASALTTYGTANIPVASPPDGVTVNAVQNPALGVTKSVATFPITGAGQVLTYTVRATNTGDVTLSNINIADPLIPSMSCTVPSLSVGASSLCVGPYTVTQADFDAGQINNTATASGSTPQGNPVAGSGALTSPMSAPSPVLTLVKSVSPSTYQAVGETVVYGFAVTNAGNVTLTNVEVSDPLVLGFNCVIPLLAPAGVDTSCATSYQVQQSDIDAGSIVNIATVTANAARGTNPTSSDTKTVTGPLREPALSVSKNASPLTYASVGDEITYTYLVNNTGNVSLTGAVSIADNKLSGVTCPALPVGGLPPGGSLTCTANHTIVLADLNAGSITNQAVANTNSVLGPLASIPVAATVNAVQTPLISLVKSAGAIVDVDGNGADAGDTIAYGFTLRNKGNVTLTSVGVVDPTIGAVVCPVSQLDPGSSALCTATYILTLADLNAGSVTNSATASGTPPIGGPVSDTSGATETDDAPTITAIPGTASIAVIKAAGAIADLDGNGADAGDTITYSFTVSNEGNVTLASVGVTDVKVGAVVCPLTTLNPGASTLCTATYTLVQADLNTGNVTNTATASGTPPSGPVVSDESGNAIDDDTATITPISQSPALAVTKSASAIADVDNNGPDSGDRITYTFAVSNPGNVTLSSIGVSDPKVGPVNCAVTSLSPAQSTSCSAIYVLTQADVDAGQVQNSATAAGIAPNGASVYDVSGSTTGDNSPTVTSVPQLPTLSISKTSPTVSFDSIGDVLTYSYDVINTGNVTILSPMTISDDKTSVLCPDVVPTGLAPGQSLTCSASYTVMQADIDAGSVLNTARANTTFGPGNTSVTSPDDQAIVPAIKSPSMTVMKTATSVNFTNIGDTVSYQYVVTNTGNTTLVDPVVINDNRVAAVICPPYPAGGLAPGATHTCTANYSVVVEDLDIGSLTNLASATSGLVSSPVTSVTFPTGAAPALTIVKTSTAINFNTVGDVIPYSFALTNSGNATFTRVINVSDNKIGTIPCFTPVAGDLTLTPGESQICTANYVITQADLDQGFVTNQANASTTVGAANTPVSSPPDTLTINAIQNPELSVTKAVTTLPVTAINQVLTYTVTTSNTGDVTLSNVVVSDPLIPALSCTIASLAPGATADCVGTYTATQNDFDFGRIDNTASATGATPQGLAVSDTGSNTVAIAQTPVIAVVKSAGSIVDTDGNGPDAGDRITYSFAASNEGNVTASGISIADAKVGAVSCPVTSLSPGLNTICTATYILTLVDFDAGRVINTATVSALSPSGTHISDISGSGVGNDAPTDTSLPSVPTLALVKSAAPLVDTDANGPDAGDSIAYTFVVSNEGNQTLSNLGIVDAKVGAVSCPVTSLAPATSTTCNVIYTLTQADIDTGNVTNSAVANAVAPGGAAVSDTSGSNIGNDTPTVSSIPRVSSMQLVKLPGVLTDSDGNGADVGDTLTYQFEVSNTGNQTLSAITVSDAKASVTGGPLATLLPTLTDTSTFEATYVLTQADIDAGTVNNSAVAMGNPPTGPPISDVSGPTLGSDVPTDTTLPRAPALTLVKTANGTNDIDGNGPDVGDTVSYTFDVVNTGNVTLTNVAINDPLVGVAALENANAVSTLVAMVATGVDPMATASTAYLAAPAANTNKQNLPSLLSNMLFGSTIKIPQLSVGLHAKRHIVRLSNSSGPLLAGESVGVYVTLTNTGEGVLTSVIASQDGAEGLGSSLDILFPNITDALPMVFSYTLTDADIAANAITRPAQISADSRGQVIKMSVDTKLWLADISTSDDLLTGSITPAAIATMLPGASSSFNGTYELKQSDIDAGTLTNTAVATAAAPGGASASDTSGTATTNDVPTDIAILRAPAVALVKTAGAVSDLDGNGPDVGDQIAYSFDVSNEGNVTLSAISITDAKIGVVNCPQTTVGPTSSIPCTALYNLTQADVDAGGVTNTANVQALAPGGATVTDTSGATSGDDAPTVTPIARQGGLTLVKTAASPTFALGLNPAVADSGDTIEYDFTILNTGNVTLTPINVSDAKIANIVCPASTLSPTETLVCKGTYVLTLADFDLGSIANTASATGGNPDGTTSTDTSGTTGGDDTPTTTTLPQTPGVTLVKTAAEPTTVAGANSALVDALDTIEYTFTVVNTGNVSLVGIAIVDPKIPTIVCPTTALAPGATTACLGNYVIIQADLDAGTTQNSAIVSATAPNSVTTTDTSGIDATNNTPTDTALPQVPLIAAVKTASAINDIDGNGVDAGDTIQYSFAVSNQGNVTLNPVTVSDTKVATITCPASSLVPAGSINCTATYTLLQVDIDRGQVENQATATGTPPVGTPVTDLSDGQTPGQGPGENDVTVTSLTQTPGLALVKIADISALATPAPAPGNVVTYNFVVTNTGNVTLTNLTLTDALPNIALTGGPLATLAPGDSNSSAFRATYEITAADISQGFVENTAIATGNYSDINQAQQSRTDTSGTAVDNNTPTRIPLSAAPLISIVKTATFNDLIAPTGANLNDSITYAFTVTNTGNVTLTGISVVDPMLTGINCAATSLNVGQQTTCAANDYVLRQSDINTGEVQNQAEARASAIVNGATEDVTDASGTAGGNNDPTVTALPIPQPTFTKTASKSVAKIGDVVTFTIRATNVVFLPANLVDQLPGGLSYVPNSAMVNGTAFNPTVSGRRLTFSNVAPMAGEIIVTLRAIVNASATDGKITNRAQLIHPDGRVVAEAKASLDIRPEPVFDCGDIIGKVFDDRNGNGIQDAETSPYVPERGLPNVRVVTVTGTLITTDKNGRFHIPCADIPKTKVGSNFILKLDPRSLPSGYRLTTENPKVVRLTRGKLTKINFGASISRVIRLDVTDTVFTRGGLSVSRELKAAVGKLVAVLDQEPSIVRLQYHLGSEGKAIASRRLKLIEDYIAGQWQQQTGRYKLPIETRLVHQDKKASN
jgi:uncharacterized repeat protein (TIGR01451 family)